MVAGIDIIPPRDEMQKPQFRTETLPDYTPLTHLPLSVICWQEAIKVDFSDKVNVIKYHDFTVRSPSVEMQIPSVVALKEFVSKGNVPRFKKSNVFLRDGFKCVYCGDTHDLTFDHVIPKYLGGKTNWLNISTSCQTCNWQKGSKHPDEWGIPPSIKPYEPTFYDLKRQSKKLFNDNVNEEWSEFI